MRSIDLNTRRANRDPVSVVAGDGQVFELPPFLPLKAMTASLHLANAREDPQAALTAIDELYSALFGEKAEAAKNSIGLNEVQEITTEAYGVTAGESPASSAS